MTLIVLRYSSTVKVDSNGCADYDDDDGDGVSNRDDNCPFTPIDEDVDNFGCHGGSVITWGWGFAGGNSSSVEQSYRVCYLSIPVTVHLRL